MKGGPESLAHAALTHIDGVGPVLAQSLVDFGGGGEPRTHPSSTKLRTASS